MNNLRTSWTLNGYKRMWGKYKIDILNTNLNIQWWTFQVSAVIHIIPIYELKQKTKSILSKTNLT